MIDAFASHAHLVDHLAPVWQALPDTYRGRFVVTDRHLAEHAQTRGLNVDVGELRNPGGLTLVASHHDYTQVRHRPCVYLEHGAGQTYRGMELHPSYSGGADRDQVVLFLTLNETTARRERARYPKTEVVVVGAPKLDRWWLRSPRRSGPANPDFPSRPRVPTVAFCWHWNWGGVPEGMSAWPEYRHAMRAMHLSARWDVLGHGHPRAIAKLEQSYAEWGIRSTRDVEDVYRQADVVVYDNSSVGLECAALGIPTVAVNASFYRRDVSHGLRFWDAVPSVQCDLPDQLEHAVGEAAADRYDIAEQDRIAQICARVYPSRTRGNAARLAATAIVGRAMRA